MRVMTAVPDDPVKLKRGKERREREKREIREEKRMSKLFVRTCECMCESMGRERDPDM